MTQQINLCAPAQPLTAVRFSARSLAQALLVVVVVGGLLVGLLGWKLQRSTADYQQTLAAQERDIQGLNSVLAASRAAMAAPDVALQKQLQEARLRLQQREALLNEIQQGVPETGRGHSDRLQLLAQTIPAKAWITAVNADQARMEITGYTLEPSAIDDWVNKLTHSALLDGQELATVRVDRTVADTSGPAATHPPSWLYHLVSLRPPTDKSSGGTP